ncbi:MAG: ribonuclease E inhibitor RraB [Planctomycetota bacterium]|jgi:Regulator of ribonuclease activity B|nr:ribonuclease E inhibitor RraB [Planctomycetota bacterium]
MQLSAEKIAASQFMLDELSKGGDDLTLAHKVEWTHTFFAKELAERFRDVCKKAFPQFTFHVEDCECNCTGEVVPTALELAQICETLGEISMQVANRIEQHSSITAAVCQAH